MDLEYSYIASLVVDQKVTNLDAGFKTFRAQICGLDNRAANLENRVSNIENRVSNIEKEVAVINSKLDVMAGTPSVFCISELVLKGNGRCPQGDIAGR